MYTLLRDNTPYNQNPTNTVDVDFDTDQSDLELWAAHTLQQAWRRFKRDKRAPAHPGEH